MPLAVGQVLGHRFENSPQPGAPLRNRTVDLLFTMANQSVAVTAAGVLNWADTRSREQIQAHGSPAQRCLAPQTAPEMILQKPRWKRPVSQQVRSAPRRPFTQPWGCR